ncbi:MAG TPA: M67 family metallopeptidase [Chitinispirillaceae bacterium]|nr:M67 family metallopeptidase [Chitinispirillaceae bacterium]
MRIERNICDRLIKHAREDAPVEACGYLVEKNGIISISIPLTNVDASSEHFSLDPKEQFEAIRTIRSLGMKLAAVYHSHPSSPARPSDEDVRLAFDKNISYVIISILDENAVIKSFKIRDGNILEENIETINQTLSSGPKE